MKKKYWYSISAFVITFLIGLNILLPIFTNKNALDYLMDAIDDTEKTVVEVSDNPIDNTSAAYNYWYAPENSFGISETKSVNWSYFKQLFLKHTDWMLEYKHYDYSEWTDGSDYLTIDRTWNDTGFWKFNLILDVPVDVYSARFTFGVDLPCLDYVERSGYEVWVNYTANATETYSCMFNWSDIASIPNLVITKGVQDDVFWFRFRRDDISAGHYEFDPVFGLTSSAQNSFALHNSGNCYLHASAYQTPDSSGYVDNITAYIMDPSADYTLQCAIYAYSGSNDAGILLDTTITVDMIDDGFVNGWYTFNFSDPKPLVTANTKYFLSCTPTTDLIGVIRLGRRTDGLGDSFYKSSATPLSFISPMVDETPYNEKFCIYATYTEAPVGNPPAQSNPYIWDGTTQHNMNTTCIRFPPTSWNVTLNDPEGDLMNITILTNESGAWTVVNQTTTGLANGTYNFTNVSWVDTCGTKYWISYNVTDGTEWRNITHYFTTVSAPTIHVVYPTNNSVDIPLAPTCHIYVNDSCGLTLNVWWFENTTGDYVLRQSNLSVGANTQHNWTFTQANTESTKYYWNVSVNNSYCNTTEVFDFTTAANRTWQTTSNWNGSIYNTSSQHTINDWNGSVFNTSSQHTISNWNGSVVNISVAWRNIQTLNGSVYNISTQHTIQSLNGSVFNISAHNTIDDWNGSVYNISAVFNTITDLNGSVYNLSDWITIDDWNGSVYNTTIWNDIQTWNGSIYNVSIPEWTNVTIWNGSIYNLSTHITINDWNGSIYNTTFYDINITKVGNISLVDPLNASLGVNVNYTYNITNTGASPLTNITVNETWFNCSCSDWNFTLVSTNLTGGISNITWYNDSCYAIINITNLSRGDRYAFNMIINITECAVNTSGYVNNFANVSTYETVNDSANHSIKWESAVYTQFLRVRAGHPYGAIEEKAEMIFSIIGMLLMIISIFAIIGVVYVKYR